MCYYVGCDNRTEVSVFAELQLGPSTGRSKGSHWLRPGLLPAFSLALRKPGSFPANPGLLVVTRTDFLNLFLPLFYFRGLVSQNVTLAEILIAKF